MTTVHDTSAPDKRRYGARRFLRNYYCSDYRRWRRWFQQSSPFDTSMSSPFCGTRWFHTSVGMKIDVRQVGKWVVKRNRGVLVDNGGEARRALMTLSNRLRRVHVRVCIYVYRAPYRLTRTAGCLCLFCELSMTVSRCGRQWLSVVIRTLHLASYPPLSSIPPHCGNPPCVINSFIMKKILSSVSSAFVTHLSAPPHPRGNVFMPPESMNTIKEIQSKLKRVQLEVRRI